MFGLDIVFPRVGFLQFWLTLAVGIVIIIAFALYLGLFTWYFGKPLRKYLTARLTPNKGIIQEYEQDHLNIRMAEVKDGQFTNLEAPLQTTETKKTVKSWYKKSLLISALIFISGLSVLGLSYTSVFSDNSDFVPFIIGIILLFIGALILIISYSMNHGTLIKIIPSKPITAKSIISINGVKTLMAWNVTPKLPSQYINALQTLLTLGYNSPQEIIDDLTHVNPDTNAVEPLINANEIISANPADLTYNDFLQLHKEMADKYTIKVTPDDVLSFSEKFLDEHARKSIIEKTITVEQKRLSENKYQKYAFIIIGLMILGGFIMMMYKLKYGVK